LLDGFVHREFGPCRPDHLGGVGGDDLGRKAHVLVLVDDGSQDQGIDPGEHAELLGILRVHQALGGQFVLGQYAV